MVRGVVLASDNNLPKVLILFELVPVAAEDVLTDVKAPLHVHADERAVLQLCHHYFPLDQASQTGS